MSRQGKTPAPDLVRPEIRALGDFNAGFSVEKLKAQLGMDRLVKLDSNENPYSCSPKALEALSGLGEDIFRYPDREELRLRAAISRDLGVAPEQLAFTAGSEDLISILFRMVLRPGEAVLTVTPGFGLYEICAERRGAETIKLPFLKDWRFPVAALEEALSRAPRILILSSPCNPAGPLLGEGDLDRILSAAGPDTLVILDEAYVEFVDDAHRDQDFERLKRHDGPWISLRTFSKAYGLAGLRIGYGVAFDADFAADVYKLRSPFNVGAAALTAAEAAYGDQHHVARSRQAIGAERARIAAALESRGFSVAPSQGNFLFFPCRESAADLAARLRRHGVLVKPWHEEGYRDHVRLTIGLPSDNDAFLTALRAVV